MMNRPVFQMWGIAAMNSNYDRFRRVTGESDLSGVSLPCGRSMCTGCQAKCIGRSTLRKEMNTLI